MTAADEQALCQQLIDRAEALRRRHPGRALEVARAGRTLAAGVDRQHLGLGPWLRLQADAWSAVGSAARARGELHEAEAALNIAICFVNDDDYPSDHRLAHQCRLAQRAAYLRASQGRHQEALSLIGDAHDAYAARAELAEAARCQVDRAAILAAAGQYRRALGTIVRTLEQGGHLLTPPTRLAAVHNAALYLYELAESPATHAEALRWLRLAIRCHQQHSESLDQLKLQGLLGLTAARLGEVERGIAALQLAALGFARHGAVAEQANALLDLARLAVAHGRPETLTAVAGALFPLLRSLHAMPEVRLAVLDVVRAIHHGRLGTRQIERAARSLRAIEARSVLGELE